jgi:branched-chain amino acid aminotransferase
MSVLPFDDRDGWIWLDGAFVPWREAKVHVLTHALHYASCVFEGERMYDGEIFHLTEHTERLFKSASILDFAIPFSVSEINAACKATCERNGLTDGYIRPLAWRGTEMIGVSAQATRTHVAIAAWPWPSYFDPEQKQRGIRLTWAKYKRPSPETAPTDAKAAGLYMICTLSKHAAERDGYADAMMLDWRGTWRRRRGPTCSSSATGRCIRRRPTASWTGSRAARSWRWRGRAGSRSSNGTSFPRSSRLSANALSPDRG